MSYRLDIVDKKILDIIQSNFPLCSHPYKAIGDEVGVSEEEAFARVMNLKQKKLFAVWELISNPKNWVFTQRFVLPKYLKINWSFLFRK